MKSTSMHSCTGWEKIFVLNRLRWFDDGMEQSLDNNMIWILLNVQQWI